MTDIVDKNPIEGEVETATKTEARQAVAPHRLRYMLGFGIAGVVAAFVVIYVAFIAA